MSRNAIDRMKSQGSVKAKQNRTKRREENAKNYGKSGQSASDKAYINGNYKKVASNKAYGYRQSVKKGEIVRGSDNDWLSDGNIYRTTKVKEDQSWNKPTTQKGKQKYAILSSHKGKQAKNLGDQFNLGTWDGMRTAKANMRKGKHLSNALELTKGLLKDTVVDASVDFMKGVGVVGSTAMAGLGGAMEDSGKVFSGIADQGRTIKDYSQGRSAIKENLKANKEALNKTGFGIGFGEMLNSAKDRADEAEIAMLTKEGKHKEAKAYADKVKKEKGTTTKVLNATGFAMDILAPTTIEDKITDGIKILGKNTAKSFKQLKDGTADLSVGFKAGASDDIFFSGKKGTTAIDKKLDNEYSKVLDNTKDTVKNTLKQNPKTQNIAKYLDVIDKPLKGQTKIDGRTLNKKYTQTKDGYVPKYVRENELYPIEKPTQKLSQQYSMFGKSNKIENVDKYAEKFIQKMDDELAHKRIPKSSNNVEEWARHVDNLSDEGYEKAMEYLKEHKPYIYDKLSRDEFAENLIDSAIDDKHIKKYTQDILDEKIADEKNHKWFTTENQRNFNNPEARRIQENNYNLLKSILKPKEVVSKTIKERKTAFAQGTKNFIDNLGFKHIDELKELSQTLKDATNLTDNISRDNVVKMLNDMLFKGDNVIRGNIPKSDLVNILNTLEDNVNYNITKQNKGFKFEYRKDGKPKTFYMTDRNGKPIPFDHPMYKYSPTATDGHFEDKMSAMTSYFNIAKKSEFEEPLKAYKKMLKEGRSLTPEQYKEYEKFSKMNEEWTRIYSELKDLEGSEYHKYAQDRLHKKPEVYDVLGELDKEETAQNLAKQKLDYIDNESAYGSDPNGTKHKNAQSTASPRVQAEMARKQDVKDFDHVTQKYSTGNIKNQISTKDKIEYGKSIGLKYINTKYGIQIPKDKQTFKNVYSNKNVSNAIDNLSKLMNKEVTLTKGVNYKEDYAKIRLLVEDNIRYLDNLGVDRKVYFNKIKEQKLKLLDAIKKDMQIGVNTKGTKPMSGTVKNTTKNIKNPLESFHVKINGKELNPVNELSMDDLQWQYLRAQGAKSIDELFDIPDANLAQRGDNIGSEISSMLRPNKTPLDKLDEVVGDTDEFIDDFERVIEKENMEHSLQLREKLNQDSNKTKNKAEIDPRTEERLKYYENKLNLPEPKSLFDDVELPPGVDEDGVIIDTKKGIGSYFKNKHIEMLNGEYKSKGNKLPSFEEFKKSVKENNPKLAYEDEKLYGVYKSWLNSYKKGLTVYNPGWHVQNFFQNKGQNALALGVDAFMPQTKAKNILKQMNGEKAKDINIFDAKNLRSYSSDEIGKLAQEFGVVDGLGEDVRNARGIFPRVEDAIDNSKLMKALEKNEQTARLHHFITQIERGMSPEQASKSVNKYLFDYSNKGKMDKVMGDFVDPFWTFHKNNARLVGTSMFEHAGKMNQIVRGRDDLEYGVQDEQNENSKYGKIQMPYTTIKDSVNGDDYNYLYKENMMPDIEGALPFDDEEMENKMNPILRMALQHSRGEGNFGNKVVDVKEGEKPGWNEITKEQRLKEVAMDLNPFMPNLVKTLDSEKKRQQKVDDGKQSQEITDKQILLDWINYITGNKGNWYRNLDF